MNFTEDISFKIGEISRIINLEFIRFNVVEAYKTLEDRFGLYLFFNFKGECIYVGQSKTIRNRIYNQHLKGFKSGIPNASEIHEIAVAYSFISRHMRDVVEGILIEKYKPIYNLEDSEVEERIKVSRIKMGGTLLNEQALLHLKYFRSINCTFKDIARELHNVGLLPKDYNMKTVENSVRSRKYQQLEIPQDFEPLFYLESPSVIGRRKLTQEKFNQVRLLLERGLSNLEVGNQVGLTRDHVQRISVLKFPIYKKWEEERISVMKRVVHG